jgi:Uma2 family endonuclease
MAAEVIDQIADEPRLTRRAAPIEEFWALPESMLHIEYINGEIIMAPTPSVPHQTIVRNMIIILHGYARLKQIGSFFCSPLDVVLPSGDVVQPDLFLLTTKEAERMRSAKRVEGVPLLAVEILSPGSIKHDTLTKNALYEENGVREYWIVDPEARSIAQLVLRKKHYVLTELAEEDAIKSAVLSGFEMNVGELLGLGDI